MRSSICWMPCGSSLASRRRRSGRSPSRSACWGSTVWTLTTPGASCHAFGLPGRTFYALELARLRGGAGGGPQGLCGQAAQVQQMRFGAEKELRGHDRDSGMARLPK